MKEEQNKNNPKQSLEDDEDIKNKASNKEDVRQGRKSLSIPKSYGAKNKVRYIEGTTKLKDGCWLSDK